MTTNSRGTMGRLFRSLHCFDAGRKRYLRSVLRYAYSTSSVGAHHSILTFAGSDTVHGVVDRVVIVDVRTDYNAVVVAVVVVVLAVDAILFQVHILRRRRCVGRRRRSQRRQQQRYRRQQYDAIMRLPYGDYISEY